MFSLYDSFGPQFSIWPALQNKGGKEVHGIGLWTASRVTRESRVFQIFFAFCQCKQINNYLQPLGLLEK